MDRMTPAETRSRQDPDAATPLAPPPKDERLQDPVEVSQAEPPARGWAPGRGGKLASLAFVGLLIAGALVVLYAWHLPPFTTSWQTTDDAYVRGRTTVIAPQVSGYVTQVF